jgi:Zn-dependent protease
MPRCNVCNKDIDLPFICNYCGGVFCTEHRLPETHACPNLSIARPPNQTDRRTMETRYKSPRFRSKKRRGFILFGKELQHLLIAWLILGFCFSVQALFSLYTFITFFVISLISVGLGFIGHELSHKFTSQRYGCHAEFRIWGYGLIMALLFAVLSQGRFIFAAPGAVHIIPRSKGIGVTSELTTRESGIISLSGPLANITIGVIFFIASFFEGIIGIIGEFGFRINILLAAFNMIPFGLFDGRKVLIWNFKVWAIITIPVWLVYFLTYLFL